jgi:phosphomannomutase/phosphoglucomutase
MEYKKVRINPFIFRAYDIRGVVGPDLNPETAELIGKAYGTFIQRVGGKEVVVGRDNRISSHELQKALVKGITSTGCDVVDIGLSTTPLLYFAVAHGQFDGGVNVTGSHNPIEYNGFKLVQREALPIAEEELLQLFSLIESEDFAKGHGAIRQWEPKEEYYTELERQTHLYREMEVVIDAGNGVAGIYTPELLSRIGCKITALYCESDGTFPNHLPDPEMEENVLDLKRKVVEIGADLGIAYDGDGDRIGVVDENGERCGGDYILILLARDLLTRHPGTRIMVDVKCSQNLIDDIKAHGGIPFMYKTGHSLIQKKMREEGILLAGEVSGHMFFSEDYYGFDDALLASCRLLQILSQSNEPFSRHLAGLPKLYSTPELKAPCPDSEKFQVTEQVAEFFRTRYNTIDIDGVRVILPDGWALVRASNTNPYLTLRFEAKSADRLQEIKELVYSKLREFPSVTLPVEQ